MSQENNYLPALMTAQEAVAEASRCLGCDDAPCQKGCPAANDVVKFIRLIAQRNFRGAIRTVREVNVLAGSCALICPVGELCEFRCGAKLQRPIAIGALQRFAAEYERSHGMSLLPRLDPNGLRVGVVGSGPAGLSAAFELSRLGYSVEIHEADDLCGGILTYGIPSHRLNPQVVNDEIDYVKAMGVRIHTHSKINDVQTFLSNHDAVFIGVGAYRPLALNIEGAHLDGVFQAVDYLRDSKVAQLSHKMPMITVGPQVIIIGGGNTAIDAAMTARFSGSEVSIFYRRREEDMPAFKSEINAALKNGIRLIVNYMPVRFQKIVTKLRATFCKTRSGDVDSTGRPEAIPVDGTTEVFDADNILIAVGQGPTFEDSHTVQTDDHGFILIDSSTGQTSILGIFAGGDAVNGGATAVQAVAGGKLAAHAIDNYLKNRHSNIGGPS